MNYKQYIKLDNINESLNSAKTKFRGTEEEFEILKTIDPTANKKWKYMDFIVKVGNQPNLDKLLTQFETLSNKGLISNKDINSYSYESLINSIKQPSIRSKQTRGAIKAQGKKDIITVNENPLVVIPLTKQASIEWGRNTNWCTSVDDSTNKETNNMFIKYSVDKGHIFLYVIDKNKQAVVLGEDGSLKNCWDELNNKINIDEVTKNTKLELEDFQRWYQQNKKQINNAKNIMKKEEEKKNKRLLSDESINKVANAIKLGNESFFENSEINGRTYENEILWDCISDRFNQKFGMPILHYIAAHGENIVNLILELIRSEANHSMQNNIGQTYLYTLIKSDKNEELEELCDWLLTPNDVNAVDKKQRTPIDYAIEQNNKQAVKILKNIL